MTDLIPVFPPVPGPLVPSYGAGSVSIFPLLQCALWGLYGLTEGVCFIHFLTAK